MKQVFHIFLKDVRRYWRESTVSIALVIAFGWNEVRGWARQDAFGSDFVVFFTSKYLLGLVVVLLPVAWAFMVVRVIHGETLVGDRQFWVTRPYEWKKLLGAKALYVLAFVNLPLVALQVYLLSKAGFPPTTYAVGLFWMQVSIALYLVLPVAVLAVVTSTVVQGLLASLMIALYVGGMVALSTQVPSSSFSSSSDRLSGGLVIGAALAIIFLQYARRDTVKSRWIMVGLAIVFVLILVGTPYKTLVERDFPQFGSGEAAPMQMALLPPEDPGGVGVFNKDGEAQVQLPVSVGGIAPGDIIQVDGVLVEIRSPDGMRWDPGWTSPGLVLYPDQKATQVTFTIKKDLFERIKALPVQVRTSIAFTVFRERNRRDFIVPRGEFAMADAGLCSVESGFLHKIQCRAPVRGPASLLLSTDMSMSTCPLEKGDVPASSGEIARAWIQNDNSAPQDPGISPVKDLNFYFSYANSSGHQRRSGICPASPLVLSNPEAVARNRIVLDTDRVRLVEYQRKQMVITIDAPAVGR
jgi:hypothetical protein